MSKITDADNMDITNNIDVNNDDHDSKAETDKGLFDDDTLIPNDAKSLDATQLYQIGRAHV